MNFFELGPAAIPDNERELCDFLLREGGGSFITPEVFPLLQGNNNTHRNMTTIEGLLFGAMQIEWQVLYDDDITNAAAVVTSK